MTGLSYVVDVAPRLLKGLWVTLQLVGVAAPAGLALGIVTGLAQGYGSRWARWLANGYQLLFRGVPLIVQLFLLYYGLPRLGVVLSPFASAVLAFVLCSGAYHSQYVRSAILSIPETQMEAARSVGLTRRQSVVYVILPQVARRALPGCSNEIVYLIKYSSLAYLVTLVDLTGQGRLIAYQSFRFFETFFVVGLVYLAIVSLASFFLQWLERRLRRPA